MRWFTFDRLLSINLLLLSMDGLAPSLLRPTSPGMHAYLGVSIALHLVVLALMLRAPRFTRPDAGLVLPPSDQAWLDGRVNDQDLSDVERLVLATRRAQHRPATAAR